MLKMIKTLVDTKNKASVNINNQVVLPNAMYDALDNMTSKIILKNVIIDEYGIAHLINSESEGSIIFDISELNINALTDDYAIYFPNCQFSGSENCTAVHLGTELGTVARLWYGSSGFRIGNTAGFGNVPSTSPFHHSADDPDIWQGGSTPDQFYKERDLTASMAVPVTSTRLTTVLLGMGYNNYWYDLNSKDKPYIVTKDFPEGISLWSLAE